MTALEMKLGHLDQKVQERAGLHKECIVRSRNEWVPGLLMLESWIKKDFEALGFNVYCKMLQHDMHVA